MTNETFMWVIGGLAAFYVMWNSALTGVLFSLVQRVSRIEGALISLSKNAAKALHSPDNHHGLDDLLDIYVGNHHDMSYAQYEELNARCEEIINNPEMNKIDKAFATQLIAGMKMLVELSKHKRSRKTYYTES